MAELAVTQKPAILVPFPKAANNHQEFNADIFEKLGAGLKIRDIQLWDKIEYVIDELLNDEKKISDMKENLKKISKPDAAKESAENILNRL
jgi:UDP-N-acetylglucosamine--N-acetylmuramyl-(pentapeptide) pyrophosphoryl-undecaprenol N-acetylglucosamine transferase